MYSCGNIVAISQLALKVYTAYKSAPGDYKHVAEEVDSLRVMINTAEKHLRSTTLNNSDLQDGQKVFQGCQSILEDLNSLLQKYKSLPFTKKRLAFQRVMLGREDITTLRARLISNATSLSSFIRRFDIQVLLLLFSKYANISILAVSTLRYRQS